MYGEEHFCPNCGATLEEQRGFRPDRNTWRCRECGQMLHGDFGDDDDDDYGSEDVTWYCDRCGAILNKQRGFSDDYDSCQCSRCGYINDLSDDNIYSSREEYEQSRSSGDDDDEDENDERYSRIARALWAPVFARQEMRQQQYIEGLLGSGNDDEDDDDSDYDDGRDYSPNETAPGRTRKKKKSHKLLWIILILLLFGYIFNCNIITIAVDILFSLAGILFRLIFSIIEIILRLIF